MKTSQNIAVAISFLMLLDFAQSPEAVAGRFCGKSLEGGVATGASQDEAQAAAISWWVSRAGALGKGYESWETAEAKSVKCEKAADGKSKCFAAGKPCLADGVIPDDKSRREL
ncbi:MAG: hypothetical protein HOP09_16535 [Hyphomicrobium sp.]|nr:hypothetical protein [Hyphomicrobium sp.]